MICKIVYFLQKVYLYCFKRNYTFGGCPNSLVFRRAHFPTSWWSWFWLVAASHSDWLDREFLECLEPGPGTDPEILKRWWWRGPGGGGGGGTLL